MAENSKNIATKELGVAGIKISSGLVYDEFIPKLVGDAGRKVYREMSDNDATVGAILFAVEMLLRASKWEVKYDETKKDELAVESPEEIESKQEAICFLEGVLFKDMEQTWDDTISMVLTMLIYGWQYTEIVYKRRNGRNKKGDTPSSKYDDGMIGIHKLSDRSQETLDSWGIDEKGNIFGMWQGAPNGGGRFYIPMAKAILFRTTSFKGSPEGKSPLRRAYRSWYYIKHIQDIEGIAIERELNGLPIIYIPNEILNSKDAEHIATVDSYKKMARDIKFNEQGGAVLPSNPYYDSEGKPTNVKQVDFQLVTAEGTRAVDTNVVIKRYQSDIARTILADFIMLGQDKGSYSLSENKTDLFLKACHGWLESIAETFNRKLVPDIWDINGLNPDIMPMLVPGPLTPDDLGELGEFVKSLSGAGIPLIDTKTANFLRGKAGMPDDDEEITEASVFPLDDEGGKNE